MTTRGDPRLLIYSQDGLGLGHLRRTTLLATEFLSARQGASALTISDSPLGRFFNAKSGHDYLKLPSVRKTRPGVWRPVGLSMPFDSVRAMRSEIIRTAVLNFEPDVVLVDHMPHGAMGELVPTLQALESRPVRMILGLRDILDAPATIRQRWHLEGAFAAVEQYYDDVLVYGSRDVFDVASEYHWPAAAARKLRYCGYVCATAKTNFRSARIRRRHLRGRSDTLLIVAMAGGGADANALFATLLRAVPTLARQRRCRIVVVTGPFLPRRQRRTLLDLARGLPVDVITTVPDAPSYLAAADLVVAMAGYNTTAEILKIGKRALLVPRSGPSAEQQMRARLFADRDWVRWLQPELLNPDTMAEAVVHALDAPDDSPVLVPDLGGRVVAARRLLEHARADVHDDDQLAQPDARALPTMGVAAVNRPLTKHPRTGG